jgi:hypothetical protein
MLVNTSDFTPKNPKKPQKTPNLLYVFVVSHINMIVVIINTKKHAKIVLRLY